MLISYVLQKFVNDYYRVGFVEIKEPK